MSLIDRVRKNFKRLQKIEDPEFTITQQIRYATQPDQLAVAVLTLMQVRGLTELPKIPAYNALWGRAYELCREALQNPVQASPTRCGDGVAVPGLIQTKKVWKCQSQPVDVSELGIQYTSTTDVAGPSAKAERERVKYREKHGMVARRSRMVRVQDGDRRYAPFSGQ